MTVGRGGRLDDKMDEPLPPQSTDAPAHPVVVMQGPFEESIIESIEEPRDPADLRFDNAKPKQRWMRTLERDDWNGSYNYQWRNNPSRRYHPLWKLMAQITFGIHLLQNRLAKSDEEVLKILQVHLNEIDMFLVRSTEDFETAIADIQERVNLLKLPLQHTRMFDRMLDDRHFRTSIIRGNESIYKIVDRSARAMNDLLMDVNNGIKATKVLATYLEQNGEDRIEENETLLQVYTSMCGNAEGWFAAFKELEKSGNSLGVLLVQLGSLVNEMSKRVGVATRRSIFAHRPSSDGKASPWSHTTPSQSRGAMSPTGFDKPLPQQPSSRDRHHRTPSSGRRERTPTEHRFENPRKQPQYPERTSSRPTSSKRQARKESISIKREPKELVEFFRSSTPAHDRGQADREPPKTAPEQTTSRDALVLVPESDTPTAKPKRRTSTLRKKSFDMLRKASLRKTKTPTPATVTVTSPGVVSDSAYSSGSDNVQMPAITDAGAPNHPPPLETACVPDMGKLGSPFRPSSARSTTRPGTSGSVTAPSMHERVNTTNPPTALNSRAISRAETPTLAPISEAIHNSDAPSTNSREATSTPTSIHAHPSRSAATSPVPGQSYSARATSARASPSEPSTHPLSNGVSAAATPVIGSAHTTRPQTPSTPRLALFPRHTPRRTPSQDSNLTTATLRPEKPAIGRSGLKTELGKDSDETKKEIGTKQATMDEMSVLSVTSTPVSEMGNGFPRDGASPTDTPGSVVGSATDRSGIASRNSRKNSATGAETHVPRHSRKGSSLSSIKRIFSRKKKEEPYYGTVGRGIGLDDVVEGI